MLKHLYAIQLLHMSDNFIHFFSNTAVAVAVHKQMLFGSILNPLTKRANTQTANGIQQAAI